MTIIQMIKTTIGSFLFKRYAQFSHGLSFRVAKADDMKALYRFRYDVYTAEGYVNPDDYPDKLFSDQYDPFSISVLSLKVWIIRIISSHISPNQKGSVKQP